LKLADAKARFSEVIHKTLSEGPQRVLRRNDTVVLISEAEYERLVGPQVSFKEYSLSAPNLIDVDLERDKSPMWDVEL
jgi:antitoxin Phd